MIPMQIITHIMVFYVVKQLLVTSTEIYFLAKEKNHVQRVDTIQTCLPFDTFYQVHTEDNPQISMAARTQSAITNSLSRNRWSSGFLHIDDTQSNNSLATDQPILLAFLKSRKTLDWSKIAITGCTRGSKYQSQPPDLSLEEKGQQWERKQVHYIRDGEKDVRIVADHILWDYEILEECASCLQCYTATLSSSISVYWCRKCLYNSYPIESVNL